MTSVVTDSFEVRPDALAAAAEPFGAASERLTAAREPLYFVPPSSAFGRVSGSAELSRRLKLFVDLVARDLATVADRTAKVKSGLLVCAAGYADLDGEIAEQYLRRPA
ncbi:hypothetical protein HDA40_000831 [Hamadaea flava]|uniref:Uncharacterized protein n=1 Tax=Hamadaea flava TaxID=1742688 RepID=A0ABV8LPV8_9ACTN|nr:hypothetical protein [Hamadaea flava]MCP2322324.1 hypothetical protein [Hamadaea flava]